MWNLKLERLLDAAETISVFISPTCVWFALHALWLPTCAWQGGDVCWLMRLEEKGTWYLWQGWEKRARQEDQKWCRNSAGIPETCVHHGILGNVLWPPLVWGDDPIEQCDADPSHLPNKNSFTQPMKPTPHTSFLLLICCLRGGHWIPTSCNNQSGVGKYLKDGILIQENRRWDFLWYKLA